MDVTYLISPYNADIVPAGYVIDTFGEGSTLFLMLDSPLNYTV